MRINFAMWGKASWQLIKMEDRREWAALDVVSKWLIATRSAVTLVTVYACVIAGLLAWRDDVFSWVPFVVLTLGLFVAHGTNNLLNDYTDYRRGVDKDNYFRTQYGVHPLVQGFWDETTQLRWFAVSGVLAAGAGVYALFVSDFNPWVIGLFSFGAVTLLAYTYPFKYWGVGELAIFLIWGPILVGGVYLTLAAAAGAGLDSIWNVVLAGVPYGLGVASINVAKHIDKHDDDEAKGVGTFPVRVGPTVARRVDQAALVLVYAVIAYLVFVPRYFTPVMLLVALALPDAFRFFKLLNRPRPAEPPEGYPAWPIWYSGAAFVHNRRFGGWLIVALLADTILHVVPASADWLLRNWS